MENRKSFIQRSVLFFKPFWKYFGIVVSLMIIGNILSALSPYLFGKGVDAVTHENVGMTFTFIGIAFCLAVLQQGILAYIREHFEVSFLDDHIESSMSVRSLKRMFDFSVGQHINEHSGVKQSIVNKGQSALTQLMYNALYNILPNCIQILVTLTILALFDWQVALVASIFVFLYVWISYIRNLDYFPKIDEIRKKKQTQSKLQSELYRNATLVISEAQEDRSGNEFAAAWQSVTTFSTTTWNKYLKVFYSHRLIIIVGQYVSLALGIYLILIGKHSVGMFVTLFAWLSAIFGNLIQVVNSQRQILTLVADIRKYYELIDIIPDIAVNPNGIALPDLRGEIEFKNVSFSYPYRKGINDKEDDLLDTAGREQDHTVIGVNLKIQAGSKIGFVGQSGSGKSTIVNLMRRFYDPSSGAILIDGINIKEINLRWLRSKIGNVEQKVDLFDRSVKDNILFGLQNGEQNEELNLQNAIENASLSDFIEKLKDHGLDTMIGEGGVKVSGGERQRIGIARALIKNPKILIFDEATSSLDSVNEKLIHDAINKSSRGRTTIIIAHRLSTIIDADKIFVVDKGRIVGEGTHTQLLESCSEYQNLIKHQIIAG